MGGGAPSPLLRTVKNDVEESYPTKTWGKDVEQRADRLQQEAVRQIGSELVSWWFFDWFFRWRPWNRSKKNWRNQRGAFWKTQSVNLEFIHVPPDFQCVFLIQGPGEIPWEWAKEVARREEAEWRASKRCQRWSWGAWWTPWSWWKGPELSVLFDRSHGWREDISLKNAWNYETLKHTFSTFVMVVQVSQRFIEHLIPSRFWSYFEILDIFGCLFVRMQRWLTLVLLSHGCSSMSRSPSFNTATQMLLRKMRHSWAFSITLRTVWKLWKMKMQNFRLGWRAMKVSNICRFLATRAMWMLLGETRFAGLRVMITFTTDTGLSVKTMQSKRGIGFVKLNSHHWGKWVGTVANIQPHQTSKIFEKLRINFASPLLFCFFFSFHESGKSLGGPKGEGRVESPSANLRVAGGFASICDAKGTCSRTRVEPFRQDTKLKELKDLEKESKEQMKHRW